MLDVACVDEGTGNMEEVVEPWITEIWDVMAKVWREDVTTVAVEQHLVVQTGHVLKTKSRSGGSDITVISSSPLINGSLNDDMSILNANGNNAPLLKFKLPTGLRHLKEFLSLTKYVAINEPGYVTPSGCIPRLRSTMHLSLALLSPTTSTNFNSNPGSTSKCHISIHVVRT